MIFKFIQYTQPAWQFNLQPHTGKPFAACIAAVSILEDNSLDKNYKTRSAQLADAGYMLWNKGILLKATQNDINELNKMEPPSLHDEYIFIRKYWGAIWATYALLLRFANFKNPFTELHAYFSTKNTKRVNPYSNPVTYNSYHEFQSKLISQNHLVSIIIPTLNRHEYLKDALEDLQKQSYTHFEVIIIDQSDNFNEDFYKQFSLDIKLLRQQEKKLWTARNNAIKFSGATYLLFFDDDSRVSADWIEEHLKCMDYFNCDISAGVSIAKTGGKIAESYNYFRWADQFDSGNALVKRSVFESIGLFDEQFNGMRMGDGEFGLRAFTSGVTSISNYKAPRVHLKSGTGGLREMGSWDGFRPIQWFAPKPLPSVVYLYKKYFPPSLKKNAILIGIVLSNIPYKYKRSNTMLALSVLLSIIKSPLLLIQYCRASTIADKMFRNRFAGIEFLKKPTV